MCNVLFKGYSECPKTFLPFIMYEITIGVHVTYRYAAPYEKEYCS